MTDAEKHVRRYVAPLSRISYLSAVSFAYGVLSIAEYGSVVADFSRKEIGSGSEPAAFFGREVCLRYNTLDVSVSDHDGAAVEAAAVWNRSSDNYGHVLSAAELNHLLHSVFSSLYEQILEEEVFT